jgi:multidrug resistance efflux pump
MKTPLARAKPVVITVLALAVAALAVNHLWGYYMEAPWTRDAHVNADIVQVAPDVSGLVTDVQVADNAAVHKGQLLFVVDRARYQIALEQAQAAQAQAQAVVTQLKREVARDHGVRDLVSAEEIEERRSNLDKALAAVATTQAGVDLAQLNLTRTEVHSPVEGRLTDRTVRTGDYVTAGKPVFAVLDTASLRVDGYFEETRLHRIAPGQPVEVRLMGDGRLMHGHVLSIAAGIEDRYRTQGASMLPNVNPAFDWVRLAQRIPVRVSVDDAPADLQLVVGRTATVNVLPPDAKTDAPPASGQAGTRPQS